jgi:hypothetical protein
MPKYRPTRFGSDKYIDFHVPKSRRVTLNARKPYRNRALRSLVSAKKHFVRDVSTMPNYIMGRRGQRAEGRFR